VRKRWLPSRNRPYAAEVSERFPRPLSQREAYVLNHLLAADFPGREGMAYQARYL
jgi:hypothetical protein